MTWLQFWLWVASFLISDYFRERLPSQTPSGVGDFNIPTATEGRPVPIVPGGTPRINAPNCIWYGDFRADEKTVSTGVVFKRDEVIGYHYRLALQYALGKFRCAGMTGIWIGDEKIWDHVVDAGGIPQTVVDYTNYDLFGGKDSGGGFSGRFRLFTGEDDQPVSSYLQNITGLDPLPAYRGLSYVMITNTAETQFQGFQFVQSTPETIGAYIGDQNQLRYIRIEVQTFDTVANGGLGDRLNLGNDHHFIGPDANPIAVAYELYLNDRWGRAFPAGDVNQASFQAAAETCWSEGIGFTWIVDEQKTTGAIQDVIEQHADCYIGPNPVTGQIEVTLSRPDYILANEFQATDDNIVSIDKWNKGDWSQTFNRVRIRYADRAKQWKETHAVQLSPGNRIIQGRTVTKELRYEGCHTASVAAVLAARSNRTLSLPQSGGTVTLNREAWQLRPGSVFSLTSSQADETDLAVRITKIEMGDGIGNSLKAEVVADISGNEITAVPEVPPTDFVPPVQQVIPFDTDDQAAFETPFVLMRADPNPNTAPRITTLARREAPNSPTEYEVVRRVSAGVPSGAYTSTDFVAAGFCVVGALRNNEGQWASGNGAFSIQVDGINAESLDGLIATYGPSIGNFAGVAVISPGLADEEWIAFDEIVDDLTGIRLENVWRACMDTGMKPHTAGARVWFIWTGGMGMGGEVYTPGNNVEMKLLPRSPNDAVLEAAATALPIIALATNTGNRNNKPLLPITLNVAGSEFPATAPAIAAYTSPTFTGLRVIPQHRLWRTQDIIWSVRGLDIGGGGLGPEDLDTENLLVSAWLHNLETDPTANRVNAVAEVIDQVVVTATDFIDIDTSTIAADTEEDGYPLLTGTSFSARLEIETEHSPTGSAANNVSYEALDFDFTAEGEFFAVEEEAMVHIHFDEVDAATQADEVSQLNQFVEFNGGAQIDTAQSVFGGSSLLLDGVDSFVRVPMDGRFDVAEAWSVDFRVRFAVVADATFCGQFDGQSRNSWCLVYSNGAQQIQLGYTTTGSNGPFFATIQTGTWVPVANTWYAVSINKDANDLWTVFIDGTQLGTSLTLSPSWFRSSQDVLIGARNNTGTPAVFLNGWVDEFRILNRVAHTSAYTVETRAHDDFQGSNFPLLVNFEGADMDTEYESEDSNRFNIGAENTSEIDTAQFKFGSASLRCDGVNTSTTVSDGAIVDDTVGAVRLGAFNLQRGDFFMQCHVRLNALPSGDGSALIAKYARTIGDGADWAWYLPNSTQMAIVFYREGQIAAGQIGTTQNLGTTLVVNTWYHFAAERVGNTLNLYFDGNRIYQDTTFFDSQPYVINGRHTPTYFARPVTIGRFYSVGSVPRMRAMDGWIDAVEIRQEAILNGAATYTVPAAPTTPPRLVLNDINERADVVCLHHFEGPDFATTDHIFQDGSLLRSRLVFAGGARFLDGFAKFGTTSLNLDGLGDYGSLHLSRVHHRLEDSDFTADIWARFDVEPFNETDGGMALISQWNSASNLRSWALYLDDAGTTNNLVFAWSVDGTAVKTAFVTNVGNLVTSAFIHFEVVRQGSSLFLFIDGVLQTLDGASDSIGADVIFPSEQAMRFGSMNDTSPRDFDGYLDEVRVVLFADHTTSFTPNTVPYADQELPWV